MSENPLVSIIVRTKDRPKLLKRALQSISAQTYRPIEVVLVNDGGCDLDIEEIKTILGDVSLNYINLEKNMGRAHAGNVGIGNAKGEYIGFLDDDDEFYPEHVLTLVEFLEQSDYKVAYTAVEFVENVFNSAAMHFQREKRWVFSKDFSFNDLLISNYIPLISLLFKSELLKDIKIDGSSELYEDWDMLIRAAYKHKFFFIDKITAVYNQGGYGQIAFNAPPELEKKATIKLYKKHQEKISAEIIFSLREELFKKDAVIEMNRNYAAELERKCSELEEQYTNLEKLLKERESYIHAIHTSRGWRCLLKYYAMRDGLLRIVGIKS